jgi:hypothetical protein
MEISTKRFLFVSSAQRCITDNCVYCVTNVSERTVNKIIHTNRKALAFEVLIATKYLVINKEYFNTANKNLTQSIFRAID